MSDVGRGGGVLGEVGYERLVIHEFFEVIDICTLLCKTKSGANP